jgi:hypothetical protein
MSRDPTDSRVPARAPNFNDGLADNGIGGVHVSASNSGYRQSVGGRGPQTAHSGNQYNSGNGNGSSAYISSGSGPSQAELDKRDQRLYAMRVLENWELLAFEAVSNDEVHFVRPSAVSHSG